MSKIIKDVVVRGRRRVTFEMPANEDITVLVVRRNTYWKLGGQVDEVFASNVLDEIAEVFWDHFEQKWMPV